MDESRGWNRGRGRAGVSEWEQGKWVGAEGVGGSRGKWVGAEGSG